MTAVLDANGSGTEGFEWGPGIDAGLPIFNRNQGGTARAQAELQRASGLYLAARQRVATEVRAAAAQYRQASAAAAEWRTTVLEPLEEQVQVADRAFNEGEVAYLFVIEMNRRLTDARLRTREAEADIARALARLERAVGRRCGTRKESAPVASRVLISMLCLAIAGCGGDAPPPAPAAKPATVTAPVKEAQLTTVTLSEEAERRLAIKTETVAQRAVPRTRTIGGEIMAPSGTALAITAPVAGTLQAASAIPTAGLSVIARTDALPPGADSTLGAGRGASTRSRPSTRRPRRRDAAALKVQRAERLVKDGSVSRRSLEEAQAELAVAEAELKAARDRVALATRSGTSSGGVVIEAPETAIVQNVHVRAGQTVAAGTPLIDLVRLATVWVRVPVYAGEASAHRHQRARRGAAARRGG